MLLRLLHQVPDLVRVFLVLFLFFNDVLFQTPISSATAVGRLWRIERRLLWFAIGPKRTWKRLVFFCSPLKADDLLGPCVLRQRLLVCRRRLLPVGEFLLQFRVLRARQTSEAASGPRHKPAHESETDVSLCSVFHGTPLAENVEEIWPFYFCWGGKFFNNFSVALFRFLS
jgi:hypothetical protein